MTIKLKYILIAILLIAFAVFQYLMVRQINRISVGIQQQVLFTKTYFPNQVSDFVNKLKGNQATTPSLPTQTAPQAPEKNG